MSFFSTRVAFLHVVFILEIGTFLRKVSLFSTVVAFDVGGVGRWAVLGIMTIVSTIETLISGSSMVSVIVPV